MFKKKINVFLGAYLNSPNAQNYNCLALANNLDKSKFRIRALSIYSHPQIKINGVSIYKCSWPHSITVYWAFFWNILRSEIIYLPKGELLAYNTFICQLFKKKSFTTIEGILDATNTTKAIQKSGPKFLSYYSRFTKVYCISNYIKSYNYDVHRLKTESMILELGTDSSLFNIKLKGVDPLKNIVMIAGNFEKKGIEDYLILAEIFPSLTFHLIGQSNDSIHKKIVSKSLTNVIQHGYIDREDFMKILSKVQLHILPSKSEGFPKVILETACCGIPSMLFSDYGANEWISHRQNGFVLNTLDEMKNSIEELISNEQLLNNVSKEAMTLGYSFDWKYKIKDWEHVLLELAKV